MGCGGQDDDARKEAIDEHKHDQLNKQKEGKGHWKGELSSNSESAVRVDHVIPIFPASFFANVHHNRGSGFFC